MEGGGICVAAAVENSIHVLAAAKWAQKRVRVE